ncbi:ABC transporter substrate-binding protein [Streptomyces sp. NPDC058690]|uniref:ABC transporter substrate-binding protein n=1 Tax=Streptomyces sp. NPDC058690 TaxID=3346600 RepID=UPI00365A028F
MTRRPRNITALMATLTSSCLLLAGCTGTEEAGDSVSTDGMISHISYAGIGGGSAPQANYNPFLDASQLVATNFVYETLYVIEQNSCKEVPWLAKSYSWRDARTLVFDIRDGVQWNDGQAFTAKDVAFTFNMIKKHDVLDTKGVWPLLDSVKATGDNQVTFSLKQPGASPFTIINSVRIVPEHIWSKVKDPTKFANAKNPVGTGPMRVKSFNPQQVVTERNPRYWQADKVKVKEVWFKANTGTPEIEQLKMGRGEYDANGMFIPNVQKSYVDRDPKHHHYWYAPGMVMSVYMNLTKAPFEDVAFRRALTSAFDRATVARKAQLGYVKTASQTGLVLPGQGDWLPPGTKDGGRVGFDPKAAEKALTEAGYEKDSQGRRLGKDGKPISFKFKVPTAYTDWVAAAEILVKNLKALGLQVELDRTSPEAHDEDRAYGRYDMMFGAHGGDCNMSIGFGHPLGSDGTAPIGKRAFSNEVRWKDRKTDDLLADLRTASSKEDQKKAVAGLVEIMQNEVPMIPIWYGAKWFQYDTTRAVGWPNAKNPYAAGGDNLILLTHLRPAKG